MKGIAVAALSENHKRRLLVAFRHADELLSQSLEAAAPRQSSLGPRYVEDISPAVRHHLERQTRKIREQMQGLLERFEIELPAPSKASSWAVKTNLTSLDIGLEDLFPEKLRGYGEMDAASARDLRRALLEMRQLLSQLLAVLADAGESPARKAPGRE